jgi:hypothetical protein
MNAIPYDRPEEDWDTYPGEAADEQLPGRPRRQWLNRRSAALFALALGAIGFYAGVRVEKSQLSSSTTTSAAAGTGRAGAGGFAGRTGAAGAGFAGRTGAAGSGAASGAGAGSGAGFAAAFGGAGGSASFGAVSSVDGSNLYVTDSSGNMIKVILSSATKITKSLGVSKSSIRPGDTVVSNRAAW